MRPKTSRKVPENLQLWERICIFWDVRRFRRSAMPDAGLGTDLSHGPDGPRGSLTIAVPDHALHGCRGSFAPDLWQTGRSGSPSRSLAGGNHRAFLVGWLPWPDHWAPVHQCVKVGFPDRHLGPPDSAFRVPAFRGEVLAAPLAGRSDSLLRHLRDVATVAGRVELW